MPASLILLLGLCGAANEQVLDAFAYPNALAARSHWKASEGTPDVDVTAANGRSWLAMPAPFGSRPNGLRSVIDRDVRLNLASAGMFELELAADRPEAIRQVSLYFRSGGGWYSGGGTIRTAGRQTLRFSKSAFRIEGTPAGWDAIDGIRIALWRAQAIDTEVCLHRLTACWNDVALILPSAESAGSESDAARDVAERVAGMLDELGLGADAIDETDLADGALKGRQVAILAYNPRLVPQAANALVEHVEGGGKIFACFKLPSSLESALGFGRMKYIRPTRDGLFSEIRFPEVRLEGCPGSVRQASWNITTAAPTGHNARVIGWWFDRDGRPTDHAALLVSDRGAYFSHILLDDDREAKKAMLAAVLGAMHRPLWQAMARNEIENVFEVGHLHGEAELTQWVESNPASRDEANRRARQKLSSAADYVGLFRLAKADGNYARAIHFARTAKELLVDAYLLSQPSPEMEGRAWWNHSGTGAYTGDWDRSARELREHGFNMILPNMLWGGVAHYASDILPRSQTFYREGDQIEQCLAAAKKHGLEVHVWKVNWNLSNSPSGFVDTMHAQGRTQRNVAGEQTTWLCPSHPENQELELESMLEVARKYDIDGLHFDYIRYPGRESCYCDGCRARFEAATGTSVADWPKDCYSGSLREAYNDWRCDQITRLVAAVSREAKKVRSQIKISAAVFGSYPSCRDSVAQDWPKWVEAGHLDFVCPMDYTESDPAFVGLVKNQLALVDGRIPVYPGIGATSSRATLSDDRVVGQIHHARSLGAAGFTIFNYHEATARDVAPGVGQGATARPAVPPHRGK